MAITLRWWLTIVSVALMVGILMGIFIDKLVWASSDTVESAPTVVQQPVVQPVQPALVVTPTATPVIKKEWPKVEDGPWTYTSYIGSMPLMDDPIYNGRMSAGIWGSPISGLPDIEAARREIAQRIVPSLTDRDSVGLSIWRNQDNPRVLLGAVDILRDQQTQSELIARKEFAKADELHKLQRFDLYLALSVDNGQTWRTVPLSFMKNPGNGRELGIDDVMVTSTSSFLVSVRPFSGHKWFQREVTAWE